MQSDLSKLEDANIQVIGISYDSVEILDQFSSTNNIEFPLLADEGSATIKAYGVLNPPTQELPFPGTMVLDENGVVQAKLFLDGYRQRHDNDALIEAAQSID